MNLPDDVVAFLGVRPTMASLKTLPPSELQQKVLLYYSRKNVGRNLYYTDFNHVTYEIRTIPTGNTTSNKLIEANLYTEWFLTLENGEKVKLRGPVKFLHTSYNKFMRAYPLVPAKAEGATETSSSTDDKSGGGGGAGGGGNETKSSDGYTDSIQVAFGPPDIPGCIDDVLKLVQSQGEAYITVMTRYYRDWINALCTPGIYFPWYRTLSCQKDKGRSNYKEEMARVFLAKGLKDGREAGAAAPVNLRAVKTVGGSLDDERISARITTHIFFVETGRGEMITDTIRQQLIADKIPFKDKPKINLTPIYIYASPKPHRVSFTEALQIRNGLGQGLAQYAHVILLTELWLPGMSNDGGEPRPMGANPNSTGQFGDRVGVAPVSRLDNITFFTNEELLKNSSSFGYVQSTGPIVVPYDELKLETGYVDEEWEQKAVAAAKAAEEKEEEESSSMPKPILLDSQVIDDEAETQDAVVDVDDVAAAATMMQEDDDATFQNLTQSMPPAADADADTQPNGHVAEDVEQQQEEQPRTPPNVRPTNPAMGLTNPKRRKPIPAKPLSPAKKKVHVLVDPVEDFDAEE